jgi:zinc resistance-associated protein
MWKPLIACTTLLAIAVPTLAYAQQRLPAERPPHARVTADDRAAFAEARIAALKAALKLTPEQEKHWPAVEQALRELSRERTARRERGADAIERLRDRADALARRAAALRRLADAGRPLYQSLDEAQKRRLDFIVRTAAPLHMAQAPWRSGGAAQQAG